MKDTKKYYWLKLPKDFFEDRAIKKMKTLSKGNTYTIIYLKMLLKSMEDNGVFTFEGVENTIAEEIALDINENEDDVAETINYLQSKNLIDCNDPDKITLTRLEEMVGSETDKAEKMRKLRKVKDGNNVTQNGNNVTKNSNNVTDCYQMLPNVTKCYTEKEKDKEIDIKETSTNVDVKKAHTPTSKENDNEKPKKHKFGTYSHVLLSDDEYKKLSQEYGNRDELIQFLDDYIEEKGYKSKCHYLAIKRWVTKAVDERSRKQSKYMGTQAMPSYEVEVDNTTASTEAINEVKKLMEDMKK